MKSLILILSPLVLYSQTGRSVNLSWTASQTASVSYNVYRAQQACQQASQFSKINSSPIGSVAFTDTSMPTVGTYCYYTTSAAGGLESQPSNKAEAVVLPASPTNLSAIVPASAEIKINQSKQFLAVDIYGREVPGVLWSINPVIGGISSIGLYQAPDKIQGNNVKVSVFAQKDSQIAESKINLRK